MHDHARMLAGSLKGHFRIPCTTAVVGRLPPAGSRPRRLRLGPRLGVPAPAGVAGPSRDPVCGGAEPHPRGAPGRARRLAMTAVALAKARATAAVLGIPAAGRRPPVPPWPCSGADTEVVLDGRLIGKPRRQRPRARDAPAAPRPDSRGDHGVALVAVPAAGADPWTQETAAVLTRVRMASYSTRTSTYVATGEPLDKAGAYAVQGLGGRLVAAVDGCLTQCGGSAGRDDAARCSGARACSGSPEPAPQEIGRLPGQLELHLHRASAPARGRSSRLPRASRAASTRPSAG